MEQLSQPVVFMIVTVTVGVLSIVGNMYYVHVRTVLRVPRNKHDQNDMLPFPTRTDNTATPEGLGCAYANVQRMHEHYFDEATKKWTCIICGHALVNMKPVDNEEINRKLDALND